jgi:hypothetical protein
MKSDDPYKQGLFNIAMGYRKQFARDQIEGTETFLLQIGKYASIRNVCVSLLHLFVAHQICDPIESISEEEKRGIWADAKRISDKKEKNYVIEVAKAIYGFRVFITVRRHEEETKEEAVL